MNDLRDPASYRVAIGSLGFAIVAALASIAWIATVHEKIPAYIHEKDLASLSKVPHVHLQTSLVVEMSHVPAELWVVVAALGGVLVGILIPFSDDWSSGRKRALSTSAAIACLLVALGIYWDTLSLCAFGVLVVALLLGLLIPSPAGPIGRHKP